ncbi:MAG: hypothetical protein KIT16_02250 [Rhodospirillaceae bacterium]|nr:hypothetical protein [Rhodospirillaceae bacterium]
MDWYFVGRLVGTLIWPAVAAGLIYGVGWLLAAPRAPHVANNIKSWFRLASAVTFATILFLTGRDFLDYAGAL